MFKNNLYNIMHHLDNREPREKILEKCVKNKLDISLENYKYNAEKEIYYLKSRDTIRVLKNLERYGK